jgi:hypothetical protein
MGPLLLALGCDGEPTPPKTTDDATDDTTAEPDLTGDTAFVPPEVDYFEPFNVYAVAYFGWDEETATGGSYLWTTGALVPAQIALTLYSAEFLLDGVHATGACSVVLTYDSANGPLAPETWTFTRGSTDHTHLGLRIPAETFTVTDLPDPDRGLLGCSRHEFDPERFPFGLFSAIRERDWGFGFGTLDADLAASVDDGFQTSTLLDDGLLVGGSFLTRGDPPYDARWFARGYALDAEGRIQTEVPLTAEEMHPDPAARIPGDTGLGTGTASHTGTTGTSETGTTTETGATTTETGIAPTALPETGAYVVFPPDWVLFSSVW